MKCLALCAAAGAMLAVASANAAYLPMRAPAAVDRGVVASWTGFYLGAGAGYGMYNVESSQVVAATGAFTNNQGTSGGRGWLASAVVGFDLQIAPRWVVGAFGDFQWLNIDGDHVGVPAATGIGELEARWAWAAGGRLGYLVTPDILTYVNGGYTKIRFGQVDYANFVSGAANNSSLPATTYSGWFLGGGVEYRIFNGWFARTEYRLAEYRERTVTNMATTTGAALATAERLQPFVQTIRGELVWRFNWGGGIVTARN